jgi:cysteinyl-tRNA synthetase
MKLHDSLTKTLKDFPPAQGRPVTIYACGPTVYKDVTIGNLRSFLTTDLLRRYLEHRGHRVNLVMNLTDVGHMLNDADHGEDKMIQAAREAGKTPKEIADLYTEIFFRDADAVGMKRASHHPKATGHIPEMIALIEELIKNGHAYVTSKGDVYYDVGSFKEYGKLSGNSVADLVAGARVETASDKKHPADFALWINNPNHVLQWPSPWGSGYPGWHLECSAMAMKYLGKTIDLHIGGEDLKFPHHECEIAQSEGATGQTFSRHWLHVSYLLVEGEKMSKSTGNFYTLSDLTAKGFSPEAVRFLLLSAHYRTQFNFTMDGLKAAERTITAFRGVAEALKSGANQKKPGAAMYVARFESALDDDLNVSQALAVAHECIKEANKGNVGAEEGMAFLKIVDDVFGFGLAKEAGEIPDEIKNISAAREKARKNKDFKESDRLRLEIEKAGWKVEDGPEGQKLKKA